MLHVLPGPSQKLTGSFHSLKEDLSSPPWKRHPALSPCNCTPVIRCMSDAFALSVRVSEWYRICLKASVDMSH